MTLEQALATIGDRDRELVLKDSRIEVLQEALAASQGNVKSLELELKRVLRRLYGPKSEAFTVDPNQLVFEDLLAEALEGALATAGEESPADEAPQSDTLIEEHSRRRGGHGRLDLAQLEQFLECEDVIVDVEEDEKVCPETGEPMVRMGEQITRKLERTPASIKIKRYIRPEYVSPASPEAGVVMAQLPEFAIPKCMLGESLIADILVSKYLDHRPLYRTEKILSREGVHLSRSTMSEVAVRCGTEVFLPLYRRLVEFVLDCDYIFSDDTGMPIQTRHVKAANLEDLGSPRMWVYGTVPEPRQVVYEFTLNRTNAGPATFLKNYSGYLQADAYAGYDVVFDRSDGRVTEVGCLAHARRKFDEALDSSPRRASEVLGTLRALFRIESRADKAGITCPADRLAIRKEQSAPIVKALYDRMEAMQREVLPKSPIATALGYAINQRQPLQRFLTDGRLRLDNNYAENEMRPMALGRKNFLFVGSERGGLAAAVIYSFAQSCRLVGVNPVHYFEDVLRRIPTHPPDRLDELLPYNWEQGPPPGNRIIRPPMPRRSHAPPFA